MSGLFLNLFEIELSKNKIVLPFLPYNEYSSKEQWQTLIKSSENIFYYRPRESDKIYYWAINSKGKIDKNENTTDEITLDSHPFIFSKLLEQAVVTLFKNTLKYDVFKSKHASSWSMRSNTDLLDGQINGLCLNRIVDIATNFNTINEVNIIGFLISTRLTNTFSWSRDDFVRNGIDLSGLKSFESKVICNKPALTRFLSAQGRESDFNSKFSLESNNAKSFEIITKTAAYINKHKQSIFLPDNLQITNIKKDYLPLFNDSINTEFLPKATRVFHSSNANNSSSKRPSDLVRMNKPFSFEHFSTKSVSIGVLCPKQFEGTIEPFFKKLIDLLKNSFHLQNVNYNFIFADSASINEYREKLYEDSLLNSDLNIIVVQNSDTDLSFNESPYFVCKAKYMGHGIPTQDIKIEKIRNHNDYILNNIALNIYAKIGGTAWAIEKEEKLKDELVIGIGSTIDRNGNNVLGIAQIFHSSGKFIVGDCAPLSNFSNYRNNLAEYLINSLKAIVENSIDTAKEFRLIFHLFKSASARYEIGAINDVINALSEYNFKYALVHVGYGHNFRLFYNDGKNPVSKGSLIRLNTYCSLLNFVPISSTPLKIAIDQRSTFSDIYYLSKQIFWFSELSHKSFNPAKKTVTIMYPSLMANMVEKLKNVEGWDYGRLNHVREKLWFI